MNQKLHSSLQIQSTTTSKVLATSGFWNENVVPALQPPRVNHMLKFPQQIHSVICKDKNMKLLIIHMHLLNYTYEPVCCATVYMQPLESCFFEGLTEQCS